MSLKQHRVAGMIPAADVDRATKFYTETLGLEPDPRGGEGATVLLSADGTGIAIYQTPSAGQAAHTLVGWNVPDVPAEVTALKAKGITFEEYDMPDLGLKTVDGVATLPIGTAAWFKDSEGNILGLFSPLSAS
jgi:predicted enzyme related to lactoylglutathione lyase